MPLVRLLRATVTSLLAMTLLTGVAPMANAEPDCRDAGPNQRFVVLFNPGTPHSEAAAESESHCGDIAAYYRQIGVGVVDSPDPAFAERLGPDRAYSAERRARADRLGPQRAPAEVRGSNPWNLQRVRADQAHAITRGSRDVHVGVLDSGVDAAHPELAAAVDTRRSANCLTPEHPQLAERPVGEGHGTHVAGIVGADDDGRGVTGVAPETGLASIRVVDPEGYAHPEYAVCGFMWAAEHDIDVANTSFLVESAQLGCGSTGSPVPREAVRRAVRYATAHDVLTVAAAGNERIDLTAVPRREKPVCEAVPAGLDGVVSVSAIGRNSVKSGYSSYGLGAVDIAAPGGEPGADECVRSTVPGGYGSSCGTSMAAPHVSGVAALIKTQHPEAGPAELRRRLLGGADPIGCPGTYDLNRDGAQDARCRGDPADNGFYGHGLVDARKAVADPPGAD